MMKTWVVSGEHVCGMFESIQIRQQPRCCMLYSVGRSLKILGEVFGEACVGHTCLES